MLTPMKYFADVDKALLPDQYRLLFVFLRRTTRRKSFTMVRVAVLGCGTLGLKVVGKILDDFISILDNVLMWRCVYRYLGIFRSSGESIR